MSKNNVACRANSYGGPIISQEECARRLGISREYVGKIERRALRKMLAVLVAEGRTRDEVLR